MTNSIATATIMGVVEGITEFLPVSSTGHLLLTQHLLRVEFSELFNVVIQSGAVLAVVPLFHRRFAQFIFQWREKPTQIYMLQIILAFMVTAAGGLLLKKFGFKLPEEILPIAVALLIGGLGFVFIEIWLKKRTPSNEVTWIVAIAVGLAQLLAGVFPGTSRSGASILFALLLGMARPAATEFSFLVGIPTMLAASGWEILHQMHHPIAGATPENWTLVIVGTLVSAVVSFVAVKWLLTYVQTHTFTAFGWYRIAVAALIFSLMATGVQL